MIATEKLVDKEHLSSMVIPETRHYIIERGNYVYTKKPTTVS